MSENLELWNWAKVVEPKYVKEVEYGFKHNSVNAQWLMERATSKWGPCGTGWGYDYKLQRDDYTNNEVVFTAHMELWYVEDGEKKHVRHCGVCQAATIPKSGIGLRIDSEASKKAVTNALSKTLSVLGFAADLWFDLYKSPGYIESANKTFETERAAQSDENIKKRLKKILEQTGAESTDDEDAEALCRFWSGGKYGCFDAFDDIDAAKLIVKAQSEMCSTIPVAKQLAEAKNQAKTK